MTKLILIELALLCGIAATPLAVRAQNEVQKMDFCSMVVKDTSSDKVTFDFATPFRAEDNPPLKITRSYSNDKEYPYDNFFVVVQVYGDLESVYNVLPNGEREEKIEKKLMIEFEDHTKIVDDSAVINHDFSTDRTQSLRYAMLPVTDDNYKQLATKRIIKIALADHETVVPYDSTNSFPQYLQCIKNVK